MTMAAYRSSHSSNLVGTCIGQPISAELSPLAENPSLNPTHKIGYCLTAVRLTQKTREETSLPVPSELNNDSQPKRNFLTANPSPFRLRNVYRQDKI
jgi:hypothetical protein